MKRVKIFYITMFLTTLTIVLPDLLTLRTQSTVDGYGYYLIDYACTTSFPEKYIALGDGDQRKKLLVETLLPVILKADEEILAQRTELLRIKKTSFYLTLKDIRFIEDLAAYYRVEPGDHREMLDELLVRVDILPPSLVLAQAAIESAWGTSRFAKEGNNLFGLAAPKGRGMVSRANKSNSTFIASRFADLHACVTFYLWNINTHPEYEKLRQIRSRRSFPYDSADLAQGLTTYSELGYVYVGNVLDMIYVNNLKAYDSYMMQGKQRYAWYEPELHSYRSSGS